MVDTSGIHSLIARARRRLRIQAALETATLASIVTSALIVLVVYLVREESLSESAGIALVLASLGATAIGAIIGALTRFPTHIVAERVDRASGLADRLGTACAFEARLAAGGDEHEATIALMKAAVRDAQRCAPRADVKRSTPFAAPAEAYPALAFAAVGALLAGLWWPIDRATPAALVADIAATARDNNTITDPVVFDDDDLDYTKELLEDLRRTAAEQREPTLEEFVTEVEKLLAKAERGEITKEQLLEELAKAEERYMEGTDEHVEETLADLKETGKELKKNPLTKELGKALEKGDLEKAKQEMDQLADKMAKNELTDKQRKQLAKVLDKVADKAERKEQKKQDQLDKQIANKQKQLKKDQRKFDQSKNEAAKKRMARRMKKDKRELKRLQRKKQERNKSASRRSLKRMHRDMKKTAENLKKQNSQQNRRQASRKMKAASRNVGKVDKDQRKVSTQKKVASQLTDLKEAMRRAKRKGNRGPKDLFGKNRKNRDFGRRARGGKGSKTAWKPGKGKGQGMGQGKGQPGGSQPGGNGKQPGGDSYGTGHDPDLMGDPTGKGGHTIDTSVSGVHGRGPSRRETILSAAQKGFASRKYKKVYASYKAIVEDVMQTEKVPSGYKYYIKKYFQKIKPHAMD